MRCDATSVLAYLFWHQPATGTKDYERRLADFHERLRADPPPGFVRSVVFAVEVPWMGQAYEDWYLVEDWTALGVLNAAAVDAAHKPDHDAVARDAAGGAGGVYRLLGGELALEDVGDATWSASPLAASPGPDEALWQRQMVLGPAPEYCLLTRPSGHVSRVVPPATQT
jgi:hypothetical protein